MQKQFTYQLINILILSGLIAGSLFSQDAPIDSLNSSSASMPDSMRMETVIDSSLQDSVSKDEKKTELEGPIKYWADNIDLSDDGSIISLKGNAKIIYQSMTLTAADIIVDRSVNTLYAQGNKDSIGVEGDTCFTETPVFSETGEEPLNGDFIEYNFDTKRGKITMGKTKMDPGYYKGSHIHKIADSTLLIQSGYFTSCEHIDDPHYYFKSLKMRVKVKDKVIAKPVIFYIADVPLMILPFGVFPNKKGRHSGIMVPKFGENHYGGKFLRGIGYYWAPSDYFDATLLTDFYDKLGFTYSAQMQYRLRYRLNGSVSGEYYPRDPNTGQRKERWRVRFNHSHIIDPTLRISGSGSFMSDRSFVQQTSPNENDRLNQNITSNINVSKSWKGTKNSMSLSANRNENLQTGRVDYTFPNLTFSRRQTSIYETITGKSLGSKRSWYQSVNFSYNSRLLRKGSHIPSGDSTNSFTDTEKAGIQHRLNFSSPQKVLKYFNITPSLSYTEDWVNEVNDAEYNPETKLIEEKKKKQFAAKRTFNSSVGLKTTLYGLFEPNIGKLKYIRHKVDPSISFTYTPDFSSPFYGYYQSVTDSAGVEHKYDRFKNTTFGGTPGRESQRMSLRLGNVFQGKLIDEEGKEKKIDFLTVNFSTNYNFKADSIKWGGLSTSIRPRIYGKSITISAAHSFYKSRKDGTGEIDEFLPAQGKLPRLLRLSTSFGFSINNKTFSKKEEKQSGKSKRKRKEEQDDQSEETSSKQEEDESEAILKGSFIEQEKDDYMDQTKKISIPWSVSCNLNYSLNRVAYDFKKNIGFSANAKLQLTKNWKISWNARFDIVEQEIVTQSFSIYRDLHCWEMSFDWQPLSDYYSFQINIKSSVLKDIKVTKHPSGSSYIPRY